MPENTIRWGIIGCGNVTEIKSGPAFNKVPGSKLVAVMRRDAEKARDYAHRHGVAKWYADADELINDPEVNAVYIATPPSSHEAYAIRSLRAGKPVYLEKPMTTDAAAARRIESVACETGVKISIAHYRRAQPLFRKIKSLVESSQIGKITLAELCLYQPAGTDLVASTEQNWRLDPSVSGGGLFHDLAPHQLDLMVYFFGKARQASGFSMNAAGLYHADDLVSGSVVFDNRVLFHGAWNFACTERKDECILWGTEGSLRFSVFGSEPLAIRNRRGEENLAFDPLQHVQQPMIAQVVSYFLGLGPNPCTVEEGVHVMQLIDSFTGGPGLSL